MTNTVGIIPCTSYTRILVVIKSTPQNDSISWRGIGYWNIKTILCGCLRKIYNTHQYLWLDMATPHDLQVLLATSVLYWGSAVVWWDPLHLNMCNTDLEKLRKVLHLLYYSCVQYSSKKPMNNYFYWIFLFAKAQKTLYS